MVIVIITALVVAIILLYGFYRFYNYNERHWIARLEKAEESIALYAQTVEVLEEDLKKVVHQKKSSEVRTGLIAEQMAPFIGGFPYRPERAIFLGKPLDFIVFDDSGIHFVEVKSGKSTLSAVQKRIKKDIEDHKITFEVYRIRGE